MPSWCPSRRSRSASCAPSARSTARASRTGCPATPSCPSGCPTCSPSSTWSSTRATPPPRATDLVRADLCAEAIRLARLLVALMPDEPEGRACSPCCCSPSPAARPAPRPAAPGAAGRPGPRPLGPGADRGGPGPRPRVPAQEPAGPLPGAGGDRRRAQRRGDRRDTDWTQILALYDQLAAFAHPRRGAEPRRRPGRARRPRRRARAVDALDLDGYHLYHATRADLLRRLGRPAEAAAAYDAAIALAGNAAERAFLERQRDGLGTRGPTETFP